MITLTTKERRVVVAALRAHTLIGKPEAYVEKGPLQQLLDAIEYDREFSEAAACFAAACGGTAKVTFNGIHGVRIRTIRMDFFLRHERNGHGDLWFLTTARGHLGELLRTAQELSQICGQNYEILFPLWEKHQLVWITLGNAISEIWRRMTAERVARGRCHRRCDPDDA